MKLIVNTGIGGVLRTALKTVLADRHRTPFVWLDIAGNVNYSVREDSGVKIQNNPMETQSSHRWPNADSPLKNCSKCGMIMCTVHTT